MIRRVCVLVWGGAAVSWELASPGPLGPGLATCAAFLLLAAGGALHVRSGLVAELRRSRELAGAARRVLQRPLPPRAGCLAVSGAQLSVGGDLYEVLPTAYGVRVVIGDVRGHGLPALGAAAAVLASFREAAYDEPALGGVLRRMERSLQRYQRRQPGAPAGEEFVTVLLLQIAADDSVLALNCGHPWPHRLSPAAVPAREPCGAPASPGFEASEFEASEFEASGVASGKRSKCGAGSGSARRGAYVRPLAGGETLPPLGVVPLPLDVRPHPCAALRPGETLVLHTDGIEDARDRRGRFFPLGSVLAQTPAPTPARLVAGVHAALLRHTGGRLADDVALLVLRNDRA
ncbi:PP2C family protein-serine/threonine phosphatase [Streptomyces sp. NBC_00091]|uniref:PP2C family protein-serine/threonine phosphatase n=1 Tax=Streptomyces sp. NBC_00091 TaxID=2975648 RepID=UPI0022568589|nr:PP2C family protein-serine/threonine phosphatase [Streptomyces sp. NBC_00091]MCX5379333.1 serine/threonine-protein phosphatase [Streptomyces sp. NBC_00091]